jgi:hypothetical protein
VACDADRLTPWGVLVEKRQRDRKELFAAVAME